MYKYTYVRGDWAPVVSGKPSVGPPVAAPPHGLPLYAALCAAMPQRHNLNSITSTPLAPQRERQDASASPPEPPAPRMGPLFFGSPILLPNLQDIHNFQSIRYIYFKIIQNIQNIKYTKYTNYTKYKNTIITTITKY